MDSEIYLWIINVSSPWSGLWRGLTLPFWDSWIEKAKTDVAAKEIVTRYQHRPREELYDLSRDPFEMDNIADEPAQAELLKSLRSQLAAWCKAQGDILPLQYLEK